VSHSAWRQLGLLHFDQESKKIKTRAGWRVLCVSICRLWLLSLLKINGTFTSSDEVAYPKNSSKITEWLHVTNATINHNCVSFFFETIFTDKIYWMLIESIWQQHSYFQLVRYKSWKPNLKLYERGRTRRIDHSVPIVRKLSFRYPELVRGYKLSSTRIPILGESMFSLCTFCTQSLHGGISRSRINSYRFTMWWFPDRGGVSRRTLIKRNSADDMVMKKPGAFLGTYRWGQYRKIPIDGLLSSDALPSVSLPCLVTWRKGGRHPACLCD
jgi:hypothetical protein